MAKVAGVVEINGHRYDSTSGSVVGVIDGFVRQKAAPKKPAPKKVLSNSKTVRRARIVSSSAKVHHRTERSRTLMRTMVARPTLRLKETTASLSRISKPLAKTTAERASHAKQVAKSPKISRFGALVNSDTKKQDNPARQSGVIKKVAEVRPMKVTSTARAGAAALSTTSHQQLERILDQALMHADAHKQTLKRNSGRFFRPFGMPRWLTILILLAAAIAAGSLIVWRSVPAVAVKMASIRSHINASVPSYVPAGYGFSNVDAAPGAVIIKYDNKTDGAGSYSVSETNSSWDSQSLQANTIDKNEAVQTSQVGGTTVYIYGSSDNAEWVNNGSLFKIKNDGHLSSDQILHIAQSL